MPRIMRCADERHGSLPCGNDGNPIGVQAEDHHWHLDDDIGTAYHAACKPRGGAEVNMSETPAPRTLWNCASCARDFVAAIPSSLAHGVASIRDSGVPKFCLFCGRPSLRPYGEISPDSLFWL